jgi:competence protein ComEA
VPTPSERRALLFVAAVAALGLGVRGLRAVTSGQDSDAPGAALAAQMAAVDSAVTAGGRPRRAKAAAKAAPPGERPSTAPEPVDVDRADAAELDRLPGIGPALAQRIVEDRGLRGPFGSLERLQDVRGIGPALASRLAPLVTFSGPPRVSPDANSQRNGLHP